MLKICSTKNISQNNVIEKSFQTLLGQNMQEMLILSNFWSFFTQQDPPERGHNLVKKGTMTIKNVKKLVN